MERDQEGREEVLEEVGIYLLPGRHHHQAIFPKIRVRSSGMYGLISAYLGTDRQSHLMFWKEKKKEKKKRKELSTG